MERDPDRDMRRRSTSASISQRYLDGVRSRPGRRFTPRRSACVSRRTSSRSVSGFGYGSSIRTRPNVSARRIGRSTHAKTTGLSTAGRCPIRRLPSTSARFCSSAAASSTSQPTAGTTQSPASCGRSLVLGLPFAGLNAAAHHLYRRDHKAVAVAFLLAAVSLLPLLLIILFHETGFFVVAPDTPGQLLQDGSISNRQLQITTLAACLWCFVLALQTRTAALSTVCVGLVFLCGLAVLSDFVSPLMARGWSMGSAGGSRVPARHPLRRPRHLRGARTPAMVRKTGVCGSRVLIIAVMELLALDGRTFHYLGVSLQSMQSADVSDRRSSTRSRR